MSPLPALLAGAAVVLVIGLPAPRRALWPEAARRRELTLPPMWVLVTGSWFAGTLYDHFGYYAPAFGISVWTSTAASAIASS